MLIKRHIGVNRDRRSQLGSYLKSLRELIKKQKMERLAKRTSVTTSYMRQEVVDNQTRHGRLEKNKSLSMSMTKKYSVTHDTM